MSQKLRQKTENAGWNPHPNEGANTECGIAQVIVTLIPLASLTFHCEGMGNLGGTLQCTWILLIWADIQRHRVGMEVLYRTCTRVLIHTTKKMAKNLQSLELQYCKHRLQRGEPCPSWSSPTRHAVNMSPRVQLKRSVKPLV